MWMLLAGYVGGAFLFYGWMYRSAKPDPYAEEESAFYSGSRTEAVHCLPRVSVEAPPASTRPRAGLR